MKGVLAEVDGRRFPVHLAVDQQEDRAKNFGRFVSFVVGLCVAAGFFVGFEADGLLFWNQVQAVDLLADRFRQIPEGLHVGLVSSDVSICDGMGLQCWYVVVFVRLVSVEEGKKSRSKSSLSPVDGSQHSKFTCSIFKVCNHSRVDMWMHRNEVGLTYAARSEQSLFIL